MDWWDFLAQQPEDGGCVLDAATFAAQLVIRHLLTNIEIGTHLCLPKMMNAWLSDPELRDLTGKRRRAAQCAVLTALAVKYRVRPDGMPIVMRADLENPSPLGRGRRKVEPDFDALRK
ncbi:MAG: DUF4224 domain-containing protein [Rhodocyclaceae bacterium]|nr:DUF4224 domain-containing protein [Rhodocyclaceae bacterium]